MLYSSGISRKHCCSNTRCCAKPTSKTGVTHDSDGCKKAREIATSGMGLEIRPMDMPSYPMDKGIKLEKSRKKQGGGNPDQRR